MAEQGQPYLHSTKPTASGKKTGRRKLAFFALFLILLLLSVGYAWTRQSVLRIRDWQSGEVLLEVRARPGDTLYFGWMHSLEKIPWHEYYHIAEDLTLVLDTIAFPAFGAGIPENKGEITWIEDGLIYMGEIGQVFEQFLWLNSDFTQEIILNNQYLTRGSELPEHRRLTLRIERRGFHVTRQGFAIANP